MFRWITIVRLHGCDDLLNYDFPWPARGFQDISASGSFELLQYAGILPLGNLSRCLVSEEPDAKSVILPVHYHYGMNGAMTEVLTDIREQDFKKITPVLQESFPRAKESKSRQFWVLPNVLSDNDITDEMVVLKHYGNQLQEFEMMMYAHPVNQYRRACQQLPISSLMIGGIEKGLYKKQSVVSDNGLVSLFCHQTPLGKWLENPTVNCHIVLGQETGDSMLYPLKETVIRLLENRLCDMVFVLQPGREDLYSGRWIHDLYYRFKGYKRLKQAM